MVKELRIIENNKSKAEAENRKGLQKNLEELAANQKRIIFF
jgi:hypothetical protein